MGYNHNVSLKDSPIETLGALTGPLPDIRPLDHSGSRTCLSKCDFGDDRILLYHRPTFDTKSISGGCIVLDDCTTTVSTGRLMRLGIRKNFNWRWDEELTITKSLKRRGCRSCVIGSRLLVLCMVRWIKKETVWRDLSAKNFECGTVLYLPDRIRWTASARDSSWFLQTTRGAVANAGCEARLKRRSNFVSHSNGDPHNWPRSGISSSRNIHRWTTPFYIYTRETRWADVRPPQAQHNRILIFSLWLISFATLLALRPLPRDQPIIFASLKMLPA